MIDHTSNDDQSPAKLFIVADVGRLKAYRVEQDPLNRHSRPELFEEWDTNAAAHLSEEVIDRAGQFRKGVSASGGEQHDMELERHRRAVKDLARRIDEMVERADVDGCYLAADSRINQDILDSLSERTLSKVERNVTANLGKASMETVIRHLCE